MMGIKIASAVGVRYNLYDAIESFEDYEEFIDDMTSFTSNDAVRIYINSPGGRIDVGMSIVTAIQQCKASVQAVIEQPSASMASLIAMACDGLVFLNKSSLMFHNYSSMAYGKGAELMQAAAHSDEYFNELLADLCMPFLTKAEIRRIQCDGDVYIKHNNDTLDKRITRHYK